MISMTKVGENSKDGNKSIVEFTGKSTDNKPTENVTNGSRFIEIDTGKLYFYDKETEQWIEF